MCWCARSPRGHRAAPGGRRTVARLQRAAPLSSSVTISRDDVAGDRARGRRRRGGAPAALAPPRAGPAHRRASSERARGAPPTPARTTMRGSPSAAPRNIASRPRSSSGSLRQFCASVRGGRRARRRRGRPARRRRGRRRSPASGRRSAPASWRRGTQPQDVPLHRVGVLELVDEHHPVPARSRAAAAGPVAGSARVCCSRVSRSSKPSTRRIRLRRSTSAARAGRTGSARGRASSSASAGHQNGLPVAHDRGARVVVPRRAHRRGAVSPWPHLRRYRSCDHLVTRSSRLSTSVASGVDVTGGAQSDQHPLAELVRGRPRWRRRTRPSATDEPLPADRDVDVGPCAR